MKNINNTSLTYPFLLIFLGLVFGVKTFSYSQSDPNFDFIFTDNPPSFKLKIPKQTSFDAIQQSLKVQYFENGYLNFSIDSSIYSENKFKLFIHSGCKYKLHEISVAPEEYSACSKTFILNRALTPSLIESCDLNVLRKIQNQGFPFAMLDKDFLINRKKGELHYQIKPGNSVVFDSIIIFPSNLISYNYISKKTGIESGKPYNFDVIKNIKRNMNQGQLFKVDSSYTLLTNSQAKIILKLKKVSQNSFSGLVGIQPNAENKTEITGNVSIVLSNAFKIGEKINLEWQKPGTESQQLETNLIFPYIFRLPVGMQFYGNFDKHDTTFTNTNLKIAGLVPLVNYGEFSGNFKWQTSSVNKNAGADLNSSYGFMYGLGYQFVLLDNSQLTKKGFFINSQIYTGNNNLIIQGQEDAKTPMHEWIGAIQVAFPFPMGSIFMHYEWGILSSDSLKQNNLYRLGGAKSIRGFNEKSIYSKSYSFSNFEYRFYLNSESFMYLLYDAGFFNEPVNKGFASVFRQAFGAGLNINTDAGHLSISYAIGKYGTEPFLVNKGKIHIGYINWF